MPREGEVPREAEMTIRVFWPNSVSSHKYEWTGLDFISHSYKVSYLEKLDPIYHELAFIDDKGVRHQFVGLAYHIEEKMGNAGGIDGQA